MRDAGISLQRIRKAMPVIRKTVIDARTAGQTPRLAVDGKHALLVITEDASSAQKLVIDALQGGQLVLAVPVISVRERVQARLADPQWRPRGTTRMARSSAGEAGGR
jgi:hypothetical protein